MQSKDKEVGKVKKQCTKCRKWKDLSEFYRNRMGKYGVLALCKKCNNKCSEKYNQVHKEEQKKYNKKYNQVHKEEQKKYNKKYNQVHKEKRRELDKKYYQEHREEIRKYNQEHKEERCEYNKKYSQEHRKELSKYQKKYDREHNNKKFRYEECLFCGAFIKTRRKNQIYHKKECRIMDWGVKKLKTIREKRKIEREIFYSGGYKTAVIRKRKLNKGRVKLRFENYFYFITYEHTFVMMQKLGRILKRNENIWHIDGNMTNNRLKNLEVLSMKEALRRRRVNREIVEAKEIKREENK